MATTKVWRDRLRIAHLGEAAIIVAYVYTPLGDMAGPRAFMRFALLPAIAVSGLVMWRLPSWRSRLRRRVAAGPINAA